MAASKKLGFYWTDRFFYLIESADKMPQRVIEVEAPAHSNDLADDIRMTAAIQKGIRDERISATDVKLTVSTDTIIRSFVIPPMKPNEIEAVVEFEAKKYIPFNLKDLSYAYHTINVVENKVKKIRIVFYAIRRALLEQYVRILEQSALNVSVVEPSACSMVRLLIEKKHIGEKEKLALILCEDNYVKIVFVHQGIVTFLRDFLLNPTLQNPTDPVAENDLKNRFINEVQNSFEFYNRQYNDEFTGNVLVLASNEPYSLAPWLQDEQGLIVKVVEAKSMVGEGFTGDVFGAIRAQGVLLARDGKYKESINLIPKSAKAKLTSLPTFSFDITNYMAAAKTAVICLIVIGVVFALVQFGLASHQKEIESINAKIATYEGSSTEDIQQRLDKAKNNLQSLRKINFKNKVLPILVYIPALLPEGVWLKNFNLGFIETSPSVAKDEASQPKSVEKAKYTLDISGYAYHVDPVQQIRMVNDVITRIRNDKRLMGTFSRIRLINMQRETLGQDEQVMAFVINCS